MTFKGFWVILAVCFLPFTASSLLTHTFSAGSAYNIPPLQSSSTTDLFRVWQSAGPLLAAFVAAFFTHTIVMRSKSGTVRYIEAQSKVESFNRQYRG